MGPISPETNPWDSPIDSCRPIKVICIGAGISGILAGIRFPQRIKNLDFTIYEKNIDVGGTWFENRYPGLGPDFSCHAYQYTFASNPNWSRFYPPGKEIQEYLQGVARKYNVKKYIRFAHLFKSAEWLEESGKWEITLERLCDKEVIKDHADVLLKATGLLNTWHWPDISGLHDFKGKLLHSADWDESYNPNNGTVAVIGYGPSGMQIIPALQPLVKSMQCYVRGKSWIAQYGPGADELKERGGGDNFEHSIEEIRQFNENPETYLQFRHKVEGALNKAQFVTFRGTEANKAFSEATDKWMKDALVKRPDIYESLKPDYPVACRRLFPGSRFLEALIRDNVEFIPKEIKHITTTGIEDEDGVFRKADTIICATGFDPPLNANESPIIGKGGTTLSQIWDPSPSAYLSMCPEKMPNFYIFLGPNSVPSAGSTIYMIESYCEYMIKCVQKLQRERLKSMTIS
ncbi:MAG: hypothetical protein M1834_005868 [Cirrosporium novae-zelandiae]|nr:MAG: hypothetical protein M1834_005868 [Cirrosporium novae-zelandiae]